MKAKIIGWHRRFALIASIAVLLWGCSGLLHPLMSWTNPRAVKFEPPAAEAFTIPLQADVMNILLQNNITQIEGLRVTGSWLQVTIPDSDERLYFSLPEGMRIANKDRDYAVMVARHYSGLTQAPVASTELVSAYSNQYTYINRYLPVWKVTFYDPRHISVYVDTGTDRLGAITDTRKVVLQTLFQTIHTGQWLEGVEPLRLAVIALLVGSVLSMSIAGIYMLVRLRGRRKGPRKIHRILAYPALFPLLLLPASGLFHLFVQSPLLYGAHEEAPAILEVSAIQFFPFGKADDVRFVAPSWWRVQAGEDATYISTFGERDVVGDYAFARQMVEGDTAGITLVTDFSDEYGFAYKRLPVWRVDMGDEILFIEAKTATIAARINKLKIAETWSFSRFHKWQFLDGLSEKVSGSGPLKNALRDAVMVVFMLLGLGMAVLGLIIRRKV